MLNKIHMIAELLNSQGLDDGYYFIAQRWRQSDHVSTCVCVHLFVYMLAKYHRNPVAYFNETLIKKSPAVHLQLLPFRMSPLPDGCYS